MLGLHPADARELAYYSEVWDTKMGNPKSTQEYTWAQPGLQQSIHALTGGNQPAEVFKSALMFLNNDGSCESDGMALHRYGDSYAHSLLDNGSIMYGRDGYTTEHATAIESDNTLTGTRPDKIFERPELYLNYVQDLANLISTKYSEGNIDGLDLCKFEEMVSFASTNQCSLIGIINYEIAAYTGENSFYVSQPLGYVPSKSAHLEHIENTKKYLGEKGVSFSTEEVYQTTVKKLFGFIKIKSKTYLGTKFNIEAND